MPVAGVDLLSHGRMKMVRNIIMSIALAALGWVSISGVAQATRRAPAFIGRATSGNQLGCTDIDPDDGVLTNNCADSVIYEIPLVYDNSSASGTTKGATIEMNAPAGATTRCRVVTENRDVTGIKFSPFKSPSTFGAFTSVATSGVAVPSNGLWWVDCDMAAGAQFTNVQYSQ